jgi:anaerobic selenocysteine-containing dehydrogenase
MDESTAYADFVLPDNASLESNFAVVPTVSARPAVAVSTAFIQPLNNTRAIEQTLSDIGKAAGTAFDAVTPQSFAQSIVPAEQSWDQVARNGGFWATGEEQASAVKVQSAGLDLSDAGFSGSPDQFPYLFQPYLSLQFNDGRAANLPWMQELPDPVSSSMWGLPVEVDPQTAAKLNIVTGDWVRVESPNGSIEAAAYIHPAALPGVVSIAVGEGHTRYGRYASNKGANPLSILAPTFDGTTGALVLGGTRVRLAKLERPQGKLVQFSPMQRETGPWGYR